jgi:hypothetical protein
MFQVVPSLSIRFQSCSSPMYGGLVDRQGLDDSQSGGWAGICYVTQPRRERFLRGSTRKRQHNCSGRDRGGLPGGTITTGTHRQRLANQVAISAQPVEEQLRRGKKRGRTRAQLEGESPRVAQHHQA